jgi:hypothetical protein
MHRGECSWQLGNGFVFEVVAEPWPVRRDRPLLLMFPKGPPLEHIRCFLVGTPGEVWHPETGRLVLNLGPELLLEDVGSGDPYLPVVPVGVPSDWEEASLAFGVGRERWTCAPFPLQFAAWNAPDPDPFFW